MRPVLRSVPARGTKRDPQQDLKLRALGARTAHVVHELKVPLSLVVGSLQTIEQFAEGAAAYIQATSEKAKSDPQLAELCTQGDLEYLAAEAPNLVAICREGVSRIEHVLGQLRGYTATITDTTFTPVYLDGILREAAGLAHAGRANTPQVTEVFAPCPPIHGDPRGLSQVFVNLIGNAFDAVHDQPEGRVWLTTHPCDTSTCGQLDDRAHLHTHVRDNGPGIPTALRERLFQPFASSKGATRGLGLGLAIAKEITEAHGGTISLAPATTPGADFVVTLPY
jgi:signal transduction histidine kinase